MPVEGKAHSPFEELGVFHSRKPLEFRGKVRE